MADQPKHNPPRGMEPYDLGGKGDLGALSEDQQIKLNKFKIKTRVDNEKYFRDHPEIECLISGFLSEVFVKRPDDIQEFAADHFNNPRLPENVNMALKRRSDRMKENVDLKNLN